MSGRAWRVEVLAFDLISEEAEDLFDRVALAAHSFDEQVTCTYGPEGCCRCGRVDSHWHIREYMGEPVDWSSPPPTPAR